MSSGGSRAPAPFPKRFRPKYSRNQNGCLPCRRRKKKCDEQWPVCLACRRNELPCSWSARATEPFDAADEDGRRSCPLASTAASSGSPSTEGDLTPVNPSSHPALHAALNRVPHSAMLFEFFMHNTCNTISVRRPIESDPFTAKVVQLSNTDEVMAHCILAMGAVHLNWNNQAPAELRAAVDLHYGNVLSGLRQQIEAMPKADAASCYQMAFKILTICHIEAINGSPGGAIHSHLRAVRQLVLVARNAQAVEARPVVLESLTMELYAYLALVSMITPHGLSRTRFLPLDQFITSLDHLVGHDTYGSVLGCGHDVFECIPAVTVFARARLDEGSTRDLCSPRSKARYRSLRDRIQRMRTSSPPERQSYAAIPVARVIRDMYCDALQIFLDTAMSGATVDDEETLRRIQHYVDEYMMRDVIVSATEWGTLAVWPCMIAGSCTTRQEQRDEVCRRFWNSPLWRVNHVLTAERVLKLLWTSNDERMYGPYGLYLVMEKHGIDMPMA